VKTLHYVDPRRGLVVGQSFGGSIAVAVAARNVPGIVATVNFAGGAGGRPSTHPGDPCRPDLFGRLIGTWGATARIPTLWLYSENDQYMGAEHPRAWFRIFRERGGRGEFVQLPAHGKDGHSSFTANPAAWRPAFEAFLKGL
jgi:dienelactone hydrolase